MEAKMGKLRDKVAIVTGGEQGLGFHMARAFGEEGAKIVLTGLDQNKLDDKAKILQTQNVEVLTVPGDVRFRSTARNTVERTLASFGRLDILVNNAQSLSREIPLIDQNDELIERIIKSGLFGTIYFMQAAYPALKRQGGAVINIGSGQGVLGGIGAASYAAAKEGIRGLSRVAAREWGRDQIRVNVICPAARSQSFIDWFEGRPDELTQLLAQVPLRRVAECEDMGRLAVYLASPDCFLTGQTVFLDGGQIMP
jgi:NAD(P)-dependent dehydrogenase (short-subunit alcohol dehydrogenase family)